MLIDVALALPLYRTFTYSVPEGTTGSIARGSRVVVPFRNKREIGIVIGEASPKDGLKLKDIVSAPDDRPVLSDALIQLCEWIAEYYVTPLGVALRTALPSALTGASVPLPSRKTRRIATLIAELPTLMERDKTFARSAQQRTLFELLENLGGSAAVEVLNEQLQFSPSVLNGLVKKNLVAISEETVERDPFRLRTPRKSEAHVPTDAQSEAIERLLARKGGEVSLLHGITGSGKTLVYLEFLRSVVNERGQTAIVLVPEIALTPQTVDRFRAVFGDKIAVLHSALSDGERYDAWLAIRRGEKRVVVGARSAIFAPLENLGAIVIDEEHEPSYKQGESPRYHAREVALMRARIEGAVVVLGTATPSLESWTNAAAGRFELLTLPDRAGGAKLPNVSVVDLRSERPKSVSSQENPADSAYAYAISRSLDAALSNRLQKAEQSILLLNRRGYSAFIQCGTCADVSVCPNCSISLTYHRTREQLVCHYCLHTEKVQTTCVRCGGTRIRQRGLGTQQVERLLGERFPSARIARMDVDTTTGKWAHSEILDRVGAGEVDILLGTQMIAKGLDFPNVTLVGVIDADVGINLPDFRASERCFQLLSQVAGRAGRGPKGGQVIIQTRVPTHYAVKCAVAHDFHGFVREEYDGRVNPAYPPVIRLANIVVSGTNEEATRDAADELGNWLRRLMKQRPSPGVTVIGAAPCPIERVKQRWRWHVLVKSERAPEMTRLLKYLAMKFELPKQHGLRLSIDRDPVQLM